jgi:hypothetical protein
MRPQIFLIALFFPLTGCAAVLGLDSGTDVADDADAEAGTPITKGDAAADAGSTPPPPGDAGPKPPPACAPDTADCNGNSADGCETALNTPQHCGSCTKACALFQSCTAGVCCMAENGFCNSPADCCSNKCDGQKCGKP